MGKYYGVPRMAMRARAGAPRSAEVVGSRPRATVPTGRAPTRAPHRTIRAGLFDVPKGPDSHADSTIVPFVRDDTEETAERNMRRRRNSKKPYFRAKARTLLAQSRDINTQLGTIQSAMEPKVSSWLSELVEAEEKLQDLVKKLNDLSRGPNAVFSWIMDFAGSLGASSVNSAQTEARTAVERAKSAVFRVQRKIADLTEYKNDLSNRQWTGQLVMWSEGRDLTGMIENVSRSFGIDQRDMLQGWWDAEYLADSLAIRDLKPWQPVCDLYQSRITPVSWATIGKWREGRPDSPIGSR